MYADLKRLAKDCNFGTTFDARLRLRDQLFMAIDSQSYFKFLMAENLKLEGLTLVQLLDRIEMLKKAHVGENVLAKNLTQCDVAAPVNKLSNQERVSCKHCGYPHQNVFCKFKHLSCRKCGIKGHLEKVCQGKPNAVPIVVLGNFQIQKAKRAQLKLFHMKVKMMRVLHPCQKIVSC